MKTVQLGPLHQAFMKQWPTGEGHGWVITITWPDGGMLFLKHADVPAIWMEHVTLKVKKVNFRIGPDSNDGEAIAELGGETHKIYMECIFDNWADAKEVRGKLLAGALRSLYRERSALSQKITQLTLQLYANREA